MTDNVKYLEGLPNAKDLYDAYQAKLSADLVYRDLRFKAIKHQLVAHQDYTFDITERKVIKLKARSALEAELGAQFVKSKLTKVSNQKVVKARLK